MIQSPLTPAALMAKAETACASAVLLLESGDVDGAVNRAYYAVFDAARAALLAVDSPVSPENLRTHSGLIGAFGSHLVKSGLIPKEIGRILNRAHEIRLIADYKADTIAPSDAKELIEHAHGFVAVARRLCQPADPGPSA